MEYAGAVLFVDDEPQIIQPLLRRLVREEPAFSYQHVENETKALSFIAQHHPEVVVVDLSLDPALGPQSGLSLISKLHTSDPTVRILALTGHQAESFGVTALQRGAASFLQKPAELRHLAALIRDGVSFSKLKRQYLKLQSTPDDLAAKTGLVSKNAKMLSVIQQIAFAASNTQPVLLVGETGTGKGVAARAIHRASPRAGRSFIRFQPSFTGHDLIGSELFGHQKGAFTGAAAERKGLIEEADRGTLFIDEADQLPHETQVLLLEVLQEGQFRPLGSNAVHKSSFRLVAATNRPADDLLGESAFREDFYHRIAHCTVVLPPLRQRREDIPEFANRFVQALVEREQLAVQGLTPEALARLDTEQWPGNIRQLQAVVEGGVYRTSYHNRRFVEINDLSLDADNRDGPLPGSFRQQVREFELELIKQTLKAHDNNQSQAAESLQLDRSSFRRILKRDS